MIEQSAGIKKGEQLTMPMARVERSPNLLENQNLTAVDIRSDWKKILPIINSNSSIQKIMEKSYQDFQEGFKIKDFRHPYINGPWSFQNTSQGIFPYMLTTTNWLEEFQDNEWIKQASKDENELRLIINNAIDQCSILEPKSKTLESLISAKNNLKKIYSPRLNQPEIWRPNNAAHWSSKWMKALAKVYYKSFADNWEIIENNSHSIVAGFGNDNIVFLLDIVLLTTDTNVIIEKFKE